MKTNPQQDPFRDPFGDDVFRDPVADKQASRRVPPGERPPGLSASRKYAGKIPGESGIWAFLFFDMWWFTALFGVTLYTRGDGNEDVFSAGHESLTLWEGTLNTLLLLAGSLFVALGIRAVREGRHEQARKLFGWTLLTGLAFLANKAFEYQHLLGDDLDPGTNDFYLYFFILTGVHALHLVAGCVGMLYMRRVAARPHIDAKGHRNLEVAATYWHLVDLLWVIIFAIFYMLR